MLPIKPNTMKKERTQNTENRIENGMEKLTSLVNYIESIGYDFEDLSFQNAVALMIDVEKVISKMYKDNSPLGLEFLEEKYCGEVEIWKKGNKTFEVPIDVHRDFSNMVEV